MISCCSTTGPVNSASTPAAIARLCDRHRGVGADGVLLVENRSEDPAAAYRMRYFNADGGEAEMCGNGARCFARFAAHLEAGGNGGSRDRDHLSVPRPRRSDPRHPRRRTWCAWNMSRPTGGVDLGELAFDDGRTAPRLFPEHGRSARGRARRRTWNGWTFSWSGRSIRYHQRFAPRGTNANFIEPRGPGGNPSCAPTSAAWRARRWPAAPARRPGALIHAEINGVQGAGSGRGAKCVRATCCTSVLSARDRSSLNTSRLGGPADFVFSGEIAV